MKTVSKYFVAAFALMLSTSAFAQFTSRSSSNGEVSKGWNSVYVSYNNLGGSYKLSKEDEEAFDESGLSKSANGFSIGYNRAIGLSSSLPLYVEVGGAFQYFGYSDSKVQKSDYDDYTKEQKFTGSMLAIKAPISLLYRFDISNTNFAIEPLLGIDLRYNLSINGKCVTTYSDDPEREEVKANLFDKEDMDELEFHTAKRFQIGWHIGANVVYDKFYLGFTYGTDFSKIIKEADVKLKTFSVNLGYRF